MDTSTLPFKTIGMNPAHGEQIVKTIQKVLEQYPDKSVNVQTISDKSGFSPAHVKNVLYLLLGSRMLKATFLPLHRRCDNAVGKQEHSAEIIYEKAERGEVDWCAHCQAPIRNQNDIQIQIIFWKPGTNVQ